jgi:hypothetical protein
MDLTVIDNETSGEWRRKGQTPSDHGIVAYTKMGKGC